ncbi:MAG: Dihydrolipoyl dehydrogenase [Chthonomonadaceae bacterium]|nr:Dihydrolipoyl dehydrogenase [Chthonomonadaceae bacterium]
MTMENCRNLIIGSGEAGKYLAWNLGKQGQQVVLVERSMIGGSCPNIACLPSKNVIYSAKVASLVGRAAEFGIETRPVHIDMARVLRRKQEMVDGLIQLHVDKFKESGAELVMGEARFTAAKTVEVTLVGGGTRVMQGERIFLNVGSRAARPDVPGLAEAEPMTHIELLNIARLPEHLVILGGGYVGLEFAQAMRRFGSRVTLIHRGKQLLNREDPDVAQVLYQLLKDDGIDVLLETELRSVEGRSGDQVNLRVQSGSVTYLLKASDILIAVGRTPNTDRLGAEKVGIALDAYGTIVVNDRLETTAPDVWAMGDCAGTPHFTHAAFDDFRVVRDNLAGGRRSTRDRLIPYCLFTDPELAHVGLNETRAQAANIPYRLARMPMAAILRTRTVSEPRGFLKALVGEDDRILGCTVFGVEANEIVATVHAAMLGNVPYTTLGNAIFTHPTVSEGLTMLFGTLPDHPTPSGAGAKENNR